MFGPHKHTAPAGYNSSPYGELQYAGTDGMSTVHAGIWLKCARCNAPFEVARVHLSQDAWNAVEARKKK